MEQKRDADAAGLAWPSTMYCSIFRLIFIGGTIESIDAWNYSGYYHFGFLSGNGQSLVMDNPSTHLGMYSTTTGSQPPTPFPTSGYHHFTPPHQRNSVNDWSIRFMSKSLPTPTTPKNFSSWRYRPLDIQGAETPNISSSP